jgi:hypothetical protein
MRDWASARWAWRGLGIAVGDGEVPTADFGLSPVRLNPDAGAEVVWGVRIDPCRMRLESVPLPESGHRWHDVVLHDVVPRGQRLLDGRPVSVFDELLRMDPSDEATHVLVVSAPGEGSRDALAATLAEAGLGVEDWTESIEMLCATCSLGEAHEHRDDGEVVAVWAQRRRLGVAGATARVEELADAWRRAEPGRAIESLDAVGE